MPFSLRTRRGYCNDRCMISIQLQKIYKHVRVSSARFYAPRWRVPLIPVRCEEMYSYSTLPLVPQPQASSVHSTYTPPQKSASSVRLHKISIISRPTHKSQAVSINPSHPLPTLTHPACVQTSSPIEFTGVSHACLEPASRCLAPKPTLASSCSVTMPSPSLSTSAAATVDTMAS